MRGESQMYRNPIWYWEHVYKNRVISQVASFLGRHHMTSFLFTCKTSSACGPSAHYAPPPPRALEVSQHWIIIEYKCPLFGRNSFSVFLKKEEKKRKSSWRSFSSFRSLLIYLLSYLSFFVPSLFSSPLKSFVFAPAAKYSSSTNFTVRDIRSIDRFK